LGESPLQVPSVVTPRLPWSGLPVPAGGQSRTDAERRFERVAIPAGVLAGVSLVVFAVVAVVMVVGWSGAVALTLLVVSGVAAAGLAVLAARAGGAVRRQIPGTPVVVWQSAQPWLGPLAATPERRLVGVASQAVGRIVGAPAWDTPALDDHRLTLDLSAELDQIDAQAYALAVGRYSAAGPGVAGRWASPSSVDPAVGERWLALLDHVAALDDYARAVESAGTAGGQGVLPGVRTPGILGTTAGSSVPSGPPGPTASSELGEAREQQLAAGAVRDEFATAHLRELTADLDRRPDSAGRGPGSGS
jgi:hypothetical protein